MLDFAADDDTAARDAMVRARAVLELSAVLDERLDETGGTELLRDLELPLVDVLARMERIGIAVDEPALAELEVDFAAKMRQAQQDAYDAIGRQDVNLGTPKQLQEVLFDQLGMPKTKRTKTGYTTDADALADLFVKTEHPFLEALLRHRDTARLRVTVEGLIKSVATDRRIHTTYIQTIAATGRLSSTDPNLQNIPIRTEEGRRIREVFVVGEGYESLMSADYSQIEMRIMAHLSGDEGLIEAFRTGEDLHRFVGARVFGVEPADVTPAMRSKIKAMSYGLAYGLSAFGLSKQLHISTGEARGLMDEYFARFGGVRDYLREIVDRGARHRLHRDDARPAPLPARPDQRQPAAPRGRRADGAQRADPGLGRRRHQARDDGRRRRADAPRGWGRGSCSRCTTSWCSRWRRGSATRSRRWCAARWARPSRWTCRSTSAWAWVGAGTRRRTDVARPAPFPCDASAILPRCPPTPTARSHSSAPDDQLRGLLPGQRHVGRFTRSAVVHPCQPGRFAEPDAHLGPGLRRRCAP